MGDYLNKVKNHFTFSKNELISLAVACVTAAFLFAFDDGAETFQLPHWLGNFFVTLIIVAIVFFIHESAHKFWALGNGFRSEFKLWPYGIAIGLIGAFLSNGRFFFLGLGGVWVTEMSIHRLGSFRYGMNTMLTTGVAFAGPLANLLLAFMFKPIYVATNIELIGLFVKVNLWYAVFSMIPIPPLDGATAFFGARSTYMLLFGIIIGSALMIWLVNNFFLMIAGALIFGLIFWFIYFLAIEKVEIS